MSSRLLIAGTQSSVGKTTVTVGLIEALRRRGCSVQPFKVGPDYIDPTYHGLAAGRRCRNLDTWLLPPERVRVLFTNAARDVDISLIEGVMGVYDGFDYDNETGSSAQIAKLLQAPVLLVLDASKLARSAAALALGFQQFDKNLPLAGFIVNRAGSPGHGRGVLAVVERATGLPGLGWLPRDERLNIPERHLGLIPTVEPGRWQDYIRAAGEAVREHLDLDRIEAIARAATALEEPEQSASSTETPRGQPPVRKTGADRPIIAVARDEAFHFTYEENLELLEAAGAKIVFFSPLCDSTLPPGSAGIILSGGFPEVHAEQLAANAAMRAAMRAAHRHGLPIYAECGGLMYLTEAIVDVEQREHAMAGLLPGRSVMTGRLTLGYRLARSAGVSWLFAAGETVRGHEFHYSQWLDRPADLPPAYFLVPPREQGEPRPEGAHVGNVWASYVHLHFWSKPELAVRFVNVCRGFKTTSRQ